MMVIRDCCVDVSVPQLERHDCSNSNIKMRLSPKPMEIVADHLKVASCRSSLAQKPYHSSAFRSLGRRLCRKSAGCDVYLLFPRFWFLNDYM